MTRTLVLGGTGFLGSHAVRALVGQGAEVCIFHRGSTETDLPISVRHVHGEFASLRDHMDEFRSFQPEVVVDLVPFIDKQGHGLAHFVGTARRAVVVTSVDVYRAFARGWGSEPGPPDPVPLTEDSPVREGSSPDLDETIDYDNREVERAVAKLSALPTTVLRLSALYGPGDPLHRLHRYVKRMDDERPAIVLDARLAGWRFSRSYVVNAGLAVAVAASNERASGRVYNVAPPAVETATEKEWVESIAAAHGWSGAVVEVSPEALPEALRVPFDTKQDMIMDSTRVRTELGFSERVSLSEALQATIEWERSHPPTPPGVFDYHAEDAVLAAIGLT